MNRSMLFLLLPLLACATPTEDVASSSDDLTGATRPAHAGECALGDGHYCGGNGVDGPATTLYRCQNDRTQVTVKEECAVRCVRAPAGEADHCAGNEKSVGLFVGSGAGDTYVSAVKSVFASDARFRFATFGDGTSDFGRFDTVIFPGGLGETEWNALGWQGKQALRDYVAGGGGFIGICAGFYLALADVAGFVPTSHIEPWARGTGWVELEVAPGNPVLKTQSGRHWLKYENGPLVPSGGDFTVLATFTSNIGDGWMTSMVGKPAVTANDYGRGRVVAFSPHPELSGVGEMLKDAAIWASANH